MVLCFPGSSVRDRTAPAKTAVSPVRVVLVLPVPDQDLSLEQGIELLDRQQLVAQA